LTPGGRTLLRTRISSCPNAKTRQLSHQFLHTTAGRHYGPDKYRPSAHTPSHQAADARQWPAHRFFWVAPDQRPASRAPPRPRRLAGLPVQPQVLDLEIELPDSRPNYVRRSWRLTVEVIDLDGARVQLFGHASQFLVTSCSSRSLANSNAFKDRYQFDPVRHQKFFSYSMREKILTNRPVRASRPGWPFASPPQVSVEDGGNPF